MPTQKNPSQGSSGCVPLTNTSSRKLSGAPSSGKKTHAVLLPASNCWNAQTLISAPAVTAIAPTSAIHLPRSVNNNAAIANIAP